MAAYVVNDPSPEEISAICREIQAGWSDEERLKRLRPDWRPSFTRCDRIPVEMDLRVYDAHIQEGERLQLVALA
jgi:hypothetical protein